MSPEEQILRFFSCGNTLSVKDDLVTNIQFCFRQPTCAYIELGSIPKDGSHAICGLRKRLVSEDGKLGYVCEIDNGELRKIIRKLFLNRPASVHLVDWEVRKDGCPWP